MAFEVLLMVSIVLGLFLSVVVMLDASSRNASWLFWGLVTVVFGIFGAVIYLILRPDSRKRQGKKRSEKDRSSKSWEEMDWSPYDDGKPNSPPDK